jgi:hypothetical protein
MTAPLRFAIAVVRAWTRLYTWRVQPALGEARTAEIESDLWEFLHDPDAVGGLKRPLHILARLVIGVPDDLTWRIEHARAGRRSARRTVALTVGAAIVFATLWITIGLSRSRLPHVPDAPPAGATAFRDDPAPPPPPPPPPPCLPAGFASPRDCVR